MGCKVKNVYMSDEYRIRELKRMVIYSDEVYH